MQTQSFKHPWRNKAERTPCAKEGRAAADEDKLNVYRHITARGGGGGGGGQVTSPWALKSPVSLKLGWDSEAHEKIKRGGRRRRGGKKKKKKMWIVHEKFNINKKENVWRLNKKESDIDVKQQPEPPPKNTKRWKIFLLPVKREIKTVMNVQTVISNWNFKAHRNKNFKHRNASHDLVRECRPKTAEHQLQPTGETQVFNRNYLEGGRWWCSVRIYHVYLLLLCFYFPQKHNYNLNVFPFSVVLK